MVEFKSFPRGGSIDCRQHNGTFPFSADYEYTCTEEHGTGSKMAIRNLINVRRYCSPNSHHTRTWTEIKIVINYVG